MRFFFGLFFNVVKFFIFLFFLLFWSFIHNVVNFSFCFGSLYTRPQHLDLCYCSCVSMHMFTHKRTLPTQPRTTDACARAKYPHVNERCGIQFDFFDIGRQSLRVCMSDMTLSDLRQ